MTRPNLHDNNLRGYLPDVTATIPHELIHIAQPYYRTLCASLLR
jgi:hypothetical protein